MQRAVQQLQIAHRTHLSSDYVTVSLGIATCIPTPERSCLTLLDYVDQALYQAKAKGRDCYHTIYLKG
jgi:two-component system, cell cycle response regulator